MEWSDHGIVLSSRPHGETGLVTTLLTRLHGRHAGFVAGGISRKSRPTWQPGNVVELEWRAKQLEQLGHYTGELREAHAARAMDDAVELAGLSAACGLIDAALPDREPHAAIFDGFHALLNAIGHPGWPMIYVRLELGLLQELGFGLDLEKCAATGTTEDLAYISPKTGRAVSRVAAVWKYMAMPARKAAAQPAAAVSTAGPPTPPSSLAASAMLPATTTTNTVGTRTSSSRFTGLRA